MKKVIIVLLVLSTASLAFAQNVDLSELDVSQIDLRRADISDADFYFAGPVDLLVRGIEYMGTEYAALLKYDGRGNVEIAVPERTSPRGLPHALDLSEIELSVTTDGLRVSNVIADGYYFSGKLLPQNPPMMAVSPDISRTGVAGAADLGGDITQLQTQVRDLRSDLAQAQAGEQEAEDRLDDTRSQLADAQSQIASLRSRLERAGAGTEDPLAAAADLQSTLKRGFSGGQSLAGSWSRSGSRLSQSSTDALFAKYGVSVRQSANELLYTFQGTGADRGWSGYGLHFLADNAESAELYGFGTSYLVWVTRDPAHTQSEDSFIQLYRSYDDVRMVQVASRAIPHDISSPLDVSVYVNRGERTIVLGVDDEAVLTFEDPNILRRGSYVAPRALGPATIRNLEVRTR